MTIKSVEFVCYGSGVANVSVGTGPVGEGSANVRFRPWKGRIPKVVIIALLMALA